jgi:peptide deformylase
MTLEILKLGAPELVRVSDPVEEFDGKLAKLAKDMLETMYAAPGIGLAAPQVGINKRLIVTDISSGEEQGHQVVLINPEIVVSEGSQKGEEGCLSIPDFTAMVVRPFRIQVKGQDLDGKPVEMDVNELQARVICHEIDHLDGILFIDRISRLRRDLIKRKIRKLKKAGLW